MLCDIYRCGDEARYLANIMKRTKSVLNGLYWSWTTASHTQKRENHRKMSKVRILIFRKNTLDIDKNKQMNYLYFSKLILSSSWSSFIIICDSIGEGRWSKNCTNTLFCQVHTPSDPHPPPPPWFHRRPYFCSFFFDQKLAVEIIIDLRHFLCRQLCPHRKAKRWFQRKFQGDLLSPAEPSNCPAISTGKGKTIVWFFSEEIELRVWKNIVTMNEKYFLWNMINIRNCDHG